MGTWNIQTIGMKMMVEGKPVAKDDGQSERRSKVTYRYGRTNGRTVIGLIQIQVYVSSN